MIDEKAIFWSQKQVIKQLNVSFYKLSKLKEKQSIKTYCNIFDDKSIYYNVLEIKQAMQTFFIREKTDQDKEGE